MVVYFLDNDPKKAAICLCDGHIQTSLLSLVGTFKNIVDDKFPKTNNVNYSIIQWTMESKENCNWLMSYTEELGKEYKKRFKKENACIKIINNVKLPTLPDRKLTPFPLVLPDKYKLEDPIESYREYYICEKSKKAVWERGTNPPDWYVVGTQEDTEVLYERYFREFQYRLRVIIDEREGVVIQSDKYDDWYTISRLSEEEQILIKKLCSDNKIN